MEKSELKVDRHLVLPGNPAIEIWYRGEMIATVYGADGPGVRVISKYPMDIIRGGLGEAVKVIEVRVEPSEGG